MAVGASLLLWLLLVIALRMALASIVTMLALVRTLAVRHVRRIRRVAMLRRRHYGARRTHYWVHTSVLHLGLHLWHVLRRSTLVIFFFVFLFFDRIHAVLFIGLAFVVLLFFGRQRLT